MKIEISDGTRTPLRVIVSDHARRRLRERFGFTWPKHEWTRRLTRHYQTLLTLPRRRFNDPIALGSGVHAFVRKLGRKRVLITTIPPYGQGL